MKKKTTPRAKQAKPGQIHIGGAGLVPVMAGRWKVEPLPRNLAVVSQEIVTPSERWHVSFNVEQVDGKGASPMKRLFGPGVKPPRIVAIFGLYGEDSPPAQAIRLDDGSVTVGVAMVRLDTGDEFLSPQTTVEVLNAVAATDGKGAAEPAKPNKGGRPRRWDRDGIHGKILQRWKDARAIKGIAVPQFLDENKDIFKGMSESKRVKEMNLLKDAARDRR